VAIVSESTARDRYLGNKTYSAVWECRGVLGSHEGGGGNESEKGLHFDDVWLMKRIVGDGVRMYATATD